MKKVLVLLLIMLLNSFNLNAGFYGSNEDDILNLKNIYLGLGYNFGSYKAKANYKSHNDDKHLNSSISGKSSAKIFVGYDINNYFAIEFSENKSDKIYQSSDTNSYIQETNLSTLIKNEEYFKDISPFFKFGLGRVKYKESHKNIKSTEKGTSFYAGLGTVFKLTNHQDVVLEVVQSIGNNKISNNFVNVSRTTLGASYKYSIKK